MNNYDDGYGEPLRDNEKIEFTPEQEAFLTWAEFSIGYTLQLNGEDPDEIPEKVKDIVFSIFQQATGNRDENKELTELDFEMVFESIINWVGNNKDGFVPLSDSMGWD